MNLNRNALGLAIGIISALCMFLIALTAKYLNWGVGSVMIASDFYIGYGASILGGIIGAVWGFVDGYIFGFAVAWLYNLLSKKSSAPQI
ncbi:MAG: bacteriophage holin [Candidatus Paceibacterota bacterium]